MFDPFSDERRLTFQVKWLFFSEAKKDRRRSKVLAIEDFVLSVSNIIFGSLGETGLNAAQCLASSAFIPCIFTTLR